MRLCQEIVLGIGGVRALRALGIHPAVWHMNEGHVAFLALERARERVQSGDGLQEALAGVKRKTVFTTHTPVPAGNETFDRKLVRRYLEPWIRDVGCEPDEALALGADNGNFNMTALVDPPRGGDERRQQAARRGLVGDVAASVSGGRLGSRRRRHERRPHGELGRARDAQLLRAARGRRVGGAPARARGRGARSTRRPRRGALGRAPLAEGAPRPLRARARARAVGAPRPLARRAAAGRGPARSARAHDRLRAPLRHLQARVPDHVRPRPAARDRRRSRSPGAVHLRGQGAPRRPRGAGGDPAAVRCSRTGEFTRAAGLPRGLRHRGRPRARAGLRRLAQHAAAPPGGERHLRPEGAGQRRRQPQHPRRLVGRGLPRRQRLGDRRRAASTPTRPRRTRATPSPCTALLENEVVPRFFARAEGGLPRRLDPRP